MFICKKCAEELKAIILSPETTPLSSTRCQICGQTTLCYDLHHSRIPKHSFGKWTNSLTGIKNEKGLLIAQCWCGQSNESFGHLPAVGYTEMIANQKLIAAAPELLEICKRVIESEIDGSYVLAANWWKDMQEVIKKATDAR